MAKHAKPFDVRLSDVTTFLAVRNHGSVTAAARALGTTPSFVSKSIARLERQLGERLVERTGRGVSLTAAASRALPFLRDAADALTKARRDSGVRRDLTVVAPSYLLHAFVPKLANGIPALRFRGVQLGPVSIRAQLTSRQFEVALSTGDASAFTDSWRAEVVGSLRSGLFTSPAFARTLGTLTPERLRTVPFVTPVVNTNGQWEPMNDECPIPIRERVGGHEAPTFSLALAIAAEANQLAFGPVIAAREHLEMQRLVEVRVPGWNVSMPAFLAVDVDRVTAREHKLMVALATKVFDEA